MCLLIRDQSFIEEPCGKDIAYDLPYYEVSCFEVLEIKLLKASLEEIDKINLTFLALFANYDYEWQYADIYESR